MRTFEDSAGQRWTAGVNEEQGTDYKGRYYLVFRADEPGAPELPLTDVRWNAERTAGRTIATMSTIELRRRLRLAEGRGLAEAGAWR